MNIQNKQHYYLNSFEPPTTRIFLVVFSFAQRKKKGGIRMKKHLLIAAGLVGVVSIQSQSALAVTKCVALNSSTTCTSNYSSYTGHTDWAATCTTNGVSTPISGIGVCSSTQVSGYQPATELDTSSTADENLNCWCKMTSPAVSRWVLGETHSSAGDCAQLCAYDCANYVQSDVYFRASMFGSLSD